MKPSTHISAAVTEVTAVQCQNIRNLCVFKWLLRAMKPSQVKKNALSYERVFENNCQIKFVAGERKKLNF